MEVEGTGLETKGDVEHLRCEHGRSWPTRAREGPIQVNPVQSCLIVPQKFSRIPVETVLLSRLMDGIKMFHMMKAREPWLIRSIASILAGCRVEAAKNSIGEELNLWERQPLPQRHA